MIGVKYEVLRLHRSRVTHKSISDSTNRYERGRVRGEDALSKEVRVMGAQEKGESRD